MKPLHENEKKELRRILAQFGQAHSEVLMAVLDTFLSSENHMSEAELRRRLKARGLDDDPELVRQALDIFCHFGFAQAKDFDGRETQYEHRHLGQHHDHLVCTRCGRVEEFVDPEIEQLQMEAARVRGFVPLNHSMNIYGLCRKCFDQRGEAVPLCEAEEGEKLVICGHLGGDDLQRRLTEMGLNSGAEIEVLGRNDGPVIVACRGCRLALGRGMSEKILVSPVQKPVGRRRRPWFRRHRKRR